MIKNWSFSSFSSFENDNRKLNQTKAKKNQRVEEYNATLQFSEFEDEETERRSASHSAEAQKILKQMILHLKEEVTQLRIQNEKLTLDNIRLQQQLIQSHQKSERFDQSLVQKNQKQNYEKKIKMSGLLKQIHKIKDNMALLRKQSERDKCLIRELRDQVQSYQQKQEESTWKDRFIYLFIDMVEKVSNYRFTVQTEKKKILIGWKIVKTLIEKAAPTLHKQPEILIRQ